MFLVTRVVTRGCSGSVLRRVYGARVQMEPKDSESYSDHRPDLSLLLDVFRALDLKVFDPLGGMEGSVQQRGGHVAFGNTRPRSREIVHGRPQRGVPADGAFKPLSGGGYVSPIPGDYKRATRAGVQVEAMLVETFGGLGPELMELLGEAAEVRSNKLTAKKYDETTWSARTGRGLPS